MKLGIVKAVSECPENDTWWWSLENPAKDAVIRTLYFMTYDDGTDASIMRLINRNECYSNSYRVGRSA